MLPCAVLDVPSENFFEDFLIRLSFSRPPLAVPTQGTNRRVGIEEELRIRIRKDHRPRVAPFENDPASFTHRLLEGHHGLPYRGMDRDL